MKNYFQNHIGYKKAHTNKSETYNNTFLQYKKDLEKYLSKFENAKILEIGSGMGRFAYFCNKIGVKDYTGIDIDDYFFADNRKEFSNYKFERIGFQDYLKNHKNEFDIIFVSHVFEHLDEKERIEMIESIYCGLKEDGIWINYMPNADSILRVGNGRWTDITHKTIYNYMSFTQVVGSCNCNFIIEHFNTYIGGKNSFKRIIHLFFRRITKIYFLGMGYSFPNIYTFEIISIFKKNTLFK